MKKLMLVLVLLLTGVLTFQNCAKTQFESDDNPPLTTLGSSSPAWYNTGKCSATVCGTSGQMIHECRQGATVIADQECLSRGLSKPQLACVAATCTTTVPTPTPTATPTPTPTPTTCSPMMGQACSVERLNFTWDDGGCLDQKSNWCSPFRPDTTTVNRYEGPSVPMTAPANYGGCSLYCPNNVGVASAPTTCHYVTCHSYRIYSGIYNCQGVCITD